MLRADRALAAGLALSISCAASSAAQQLAPPDISGVWFTLAVVAPGGDGASGFRDPPLSENGQAIVDAFRNQYDLTGHEPNAHCIEPGMPTMLFGYGGAPTEIIQQDDRITMLHEAGMQVRRIYIDDRGHPTDYPATRSGHSIARWDGEALLVDTTLMLEWLLPRWPHTEDVRIEERISLQPHETLDIPDGFRGWRPESRSALILVDELTLTDPNLYDEPHSITIYLTRESDDMILEDNCPEGLWWDVMETLKRE